MDGVVAPLSRKYTGLDLDPATVDQFKRIFDEHKDACIVLSSTWRTEFTLDQMKTIFAEYGFPEAPFVDQTPVKLSYVERASEVLMWMRDNPEFKGRYAAIDDAPDTHSVHKDNWFLTEPHIGLTEEITDKIIEHLGK